MVPDINGVPPVLQDEVDSGEFVRIPTYFNMWKQDYPDLKVSRPIKDICKDCYVHENCHRHFSNQTMRLGNSNGKDENDGEEQGKGNGSNDNNADVDDLNSLTAIGVQAVMKNFNPIAFSHRNQYKKDNKHKHNNNHSHPHHVNL